jgi:hypothetical protein
VSIDKAQEAQVLHYLRASAMEIGLVMNFGPDAKFRRIVCRMRGRREYLPTRSNSPLAWEDKLWG